MFTCPTCQRTITPDQNPYPTITTGYGEDKDGNKHCYDCCANQEREYMRQHGRTILYLSFENSQPVVTDWPGKLRIKCGYYKVGRHNIARKRYDTWFAFEGYVWHAVQYGENTQIAHCKRTKERC